MLTNGRHVRPAVFRSSFLLQYQMLMNLTDCAIQDSDPEIGCSFQNMHEDSNPAKKFWMRAS